MSIVDALELAPLPAALFECPSLKYVTCNRKARDSADARVEGDPRGQAILDNMLAEGESGEWFELLDISDPCREALRTEPDEVVQRETDSGWFSVSHIPSNPDLSRPDLVLVTYLQHYTGSGKTAALIEHMRTTTVLQINEQAHRTVRMLEDVLVQVQAALRAQETLVELANEKSERITQLADDTPRFGSP